MKKELFALAFIWLVICFFCREILLNQMSPFWGDIPLQFYPWKDYARSMLASGEIPYWNPYTYGGTPFLANMQSAVFYPLDLMLFVLPMEWFYGFSLLLHLLLAGTGAYLFARVCGATPLPSMVAGIAYGLSGFTMIHIPAGNHLTYAGAAWVPWILFATVGFIRTNKSKLSWALGGCFIAFLHFLCGHPQMTFYSLFFSVVLCFVLGVWIYCKEEERAIVYPLLRTGAWGIFLVLGILLAGFQLIPTLEYLGQANRAAVLDVEMATEFSFAPHRLITLLFPEFYGTQIGGNHYDYFYYWSNAYAGVIVPLLAIILLFKKDKPVTVWPLAIVAFLGLFLAWGRGNPVYTSLLHLPGFGHFRAPAKYLPYYLAAVSVLASLSLERLCGEAYLKQKKNVEKPDSIWYAWAVTILLIAIIPFGGPRFLNLMETIRSLSADNREMIQLLSVFHGVLLGLAAFALYLWAKRIPRHPRMAISLSFALLLALDLNVYGMGYLDICLWSPAQIRHSNAPPQEVGFLNSYHDKKIPYRIMTMADIYYPNKYMLWKMHNIAGYDPMSLQSYNRLIGRMEGWDEGVFHDNIQLTQYDSPVLDLLNVRYVLTRTTIDDPSLDLLYTTNKSVQVYQRTQSEYTWASFIQREDDRLPDNVEWKAADKNIKVQTYEPHRIIFTYQNDGQPVWLRLSEWAYPGWTASLYENGNRMKALEVMPSKQGFRVLALPEGKSTTQMVYQPSWSGWLLSIVAGFIYLVLLLFCLLIHTNWMLKFMQIVMGRNY